MSDHKIVELKGKDLSLEAILNIAVYQHQVHFSKTAERKIKADRKKLEKQIKERPDIAIYGTNRLHGDLKNKEVSINLIAEYQKKYVDVHNCGTGKALPVEVVRAMMVIRLNSFAKGMSGMKWDTCEFMIEMLNKGVTPWILEEGSVGASGDLVPLAMLAAVVIGHKDAYAYYEGKKYRAPAALKKAGLTKVELGAKEAMGITNGANFIAAWGVLAYHKIDVLLKNASIVGALSLEAIRGERNAFLEIINEQSNRHPGQIHIAQQIRKLTEGSQRASVAAQLDFFVDREKEANKTDQDDNVYKNALDKIIVKKAKLIEHIESDEILAPHKKAGINILEKFEEHLRGDQLIEALSCIHKDFKNWLKKICKKVYPKIDPLSSQFLNLPILQKISPRINDLINVFPHKERVQDRYSFRCMPHVHGAAYEALLHLKNTLTTEVNSATDNPLFDFSKNDPLTGGVRFASGGNFHGQALATVIDYVKIALTSVGLVSDKRSFSILDHRLSYGLPSNLAYDTSKADGGLMIAQYAGAARAAESRVLSSPASVTSVSTSAGQEDFVSMGSIGVLHLHKIIENTQKLVGIELLCALRALQLTYTKLPAHLQGLGKGTQEVYNFLCDTSQLPKDKNKNDDFYLKDHYLRWDMEKAIELVQSGILVEKVSGIL